MWTMGRELDVALGGETGEGTSGGTGLRGLCVPPVPSELYDGEDGLNPEGKCCFLQSSADSKSVRAWISLSPPPPAPLSRQEQNAHIKI